MSKSKDKEQKTTRKDTTIRPDDYEKRGLDFIRCPRHGVSYPRGSSCPRCKSE